MNGTQGFIDRAVSGVQVDFLNSAFLNSFIESAARFLWVYGIKIVFALLILLVGRIVSRQLTNAVCKFMKKANVDDILTSFITNIVYYLSLSAFVVAALGQAGVNVTSFIAVLGAAGLAIGLALKDTLSNFAAGVMLILLRLFKKGDYVTIAGTSGTVQTLSAFYTELFTPDNQKVVVPNSSILSAVIVNSTANATRRIDLVIGISYEDDILKAKEIIHDILSEDSRVQRNPEPTVVVGALADSSVDLLVRPWVKTSDYWETRWDLLEGIKVTFDKAGISIPYPQTDIHLYKDKLEQN